MGLAIFDLDNTLLAGDSDYLWGQFLVRQGIVDSDDYERKNQAFYDQYKAGTLDIFAFQAFSQEPLTRFNMSELAELHEQFMQESIHPIISPAATKLVDQHRQQGDTLLIITATNRFITAPIAEAFGIPHLLATDPEIQDNRYTGRVSGVPCFQEGKVTRLEQWLSQTQHSLDDSWFYSDSHNDLPLLRQVTRPVAVDPDPQLRQEAERLNWPILHLHHTQDENTNGV